MGGFAQSATRTASIAMSTGETADAATLPFRGSTGLRERLRRATASPATRAYMPDRKHPDLFDIEKGWPEEWFDPSFMEAFIDDSADGWSRVITEHLPGDVISFKMFSDEFCQMLLEEVDNFQSTGIPARRPNSMNNYGIILNEIGWKPMVDILQEAVLAKISAKYWPHITPFDDHHTFIVRYKQDEDKHLDMHIDDSDVTFNLCLGRDFTGSPLTFCGFMGEPGHRKLRHTFHHTVGTCIVHLGRLRHGAGDITSGERINLIIWNHSSTYRASAEYTDPPYFKESGPPDHVCLSYTHDCDYGVFKQYEEGHPNEEFQGRGWCPRRGYEYDGFKAEPRH